MDLIPRIFNKISSFLFKKFVIKNCKCCGSNVYAGYNWSIIHPEFISIGNNFIASENLRLQCWLTNEDGIHFSPEIIIGNNVSMISNCQLSAINKIVIGDGCLFGDNVFITDNFHGEISLDELGVSPTLRKLSSKGSVIVGKNCWLGRNVCVMPGVIIGDGCIIGANAVVTKSIPDYSVVAGVPAKIIKKLR